MRLKCYINHEIIEMNQKPLKRIIIDQTRELPHKRVLKFPVETPV